MDYNESELPREQDWNYQSAIGQINYIAMNTCLDISAAVHQCARFSETPMKIHEESVKQITWYLKWTSLQGIRIKPGSSKTTLNCYVDANFAGNWNKDNAENPASVVSHTGFVIRFLDSQYTLGKLTANWNCTQHNWGWIYCSFHSNSLYHTNESVRKTSLRERKHRIRESNPYTTRHLMIFSLLGVPLVFYFSFNCFSSFFCTWLFHFNCNSSDTELHIILTYLNIFM